MIILLSKEYINNWDSSSFLLWMIKDEEHFDWIWYQWFESILACIPNLVANNIWVELLQKHFDTEIRAWVEN